MSYAVQALLYTLQGEGARAGRPAVFIRFAGCNLWSGREADRASAICRFCDTRFVGEPDAGGGRYATAAELAGAAAAQWPGGGAPYAVCTGGEPALQLDADLIAALHGEGFEVAVETNGTLPLPPGLDWICVSPKAGTELAVQSGHELKLIHPQPAGEPERYRGLAFEHRYLQPLEELDGTRHTEETVAYCLANPDWSLSLQQHKILGIP